MERASGMTGSHVAPYGPNTPAIRRFLVRFAALGAAQRAAVMTAYRDASETSDWERAELLLARTMESSGRNDIPEAIAGPLMQLVRNDNRTQDDDAHAIDPIAEPTLAALLALAVEDLLPREQLEALYAPFAATIPLADLR